MRAVGRRFYSVFNFNLGSYLVSLQDGDWEVEVGYGDPLPFSPEMISSVSSFDVNNRGELLMRVQGPGRAYILFKSGSEVKPVMHNAQPVDGSYIGVQNQILQDDGTAYLIGFDQFLRYLLVRADPL
jgi:hypothetical protein